MPMSLPRQRFGAWQIAGAPDRPGVYVLWQGEEIVYIGRAATSLRARLMEHYTRRAKPWDATHFAILAAERPAVREAELLASMRSTLGRLPRYNASA